MQYVYIMYIYIAIYCNTVYGWKGDVWINTCFNDLDDDHLLEKTKWRYVIARAAIFEMTVEEHGSTKTTTISRRKAGQLQQQTVFYHFSACHQRPRVLASSQMPQMHSTHWSAAERRNYIHTGKLSKLLDHSKHNKLNEKSNTTGEKKDKWRTSTLRGWLPFAARKRGHASFGTYHKITETGGSWDSHSFLFVRWEFSWPSHIHPT